MFCLEMTASARPYGRTAVYSKLDIFPGYPYCQNINGMEITLIRLEKIHQVTIVSVYHSPKVAISNMCRALQHILAQLSTQFNIFIGDFNINYLVDNTLKRSLYNLFVRDHNYRQLVSCYTTDYRTVIDHTLTKIMPILYLFYTYFICYFIPITFVFFHYFPGLF